MTRSDAEGTRLALPGCICGALTNYALRLFVAPSSEAITQHAMLRFVLRWLTRPIGITRRRIAGLVQMSTNGVRQWRARSSTGHVLSRVSSALLLLLTCLFIACTFIDILRQSFSTGQFWNSIIVIGFLGVVVLWACTLHFLRLLRISRGLSAIPRRNQLRASDLGTRMTPHVRDAHLRCEQLFKAQAAAANVEHPGMQNPSDPNPIEVPFWELSSIIPQFLEDHFTTADPDFVIPKNCSLREFVQIAIAKRSLDPESYPAANRFVEMYDVFRYSGKTVSKEFLLELIECLKLVVGGIRQSGTTPWFAPRAASAQNSVLVYSDSSLSSRSLRGSVRTDLSQLSQVSPRTPWR